ncbi:MAG: invasin domain 3-containing protein, partial [Planctomycetota bacterium]
MSRTCFVSLMAAGVLLASAPGPAYLVNVSSKGEERSWDLDTPAANVVDGKVTFFIDDDGIPDVTTGQFQDAVRGALQAWEDVEHSDVAFLEDPTRSANKRNASDKVNWIGFLNGEVPSFTYAVAYRKFKGDRITDADIVFNPDVRLSDDSNAPWSVATPGQVNTADVQAVATHEWGHCLGFDHVPLGASTMYFALPAGATMFRTLEPDDMAGAGHSYPAADFPTVTATIAGEVDVSGTSNERGVQVSAIDYVTGKPAAGAISRPDGTWTLEGLESGVYRLVASPMGRARTRGGTYADFWSNAVTDLVPVVVEESPGVTRVFAVEEGETVAGIEIDIDAGEDGNEPNDVQGQETDIEVGGSSSGTIDATDDVDRFAFDGTAGEVVSVYVHAGQIGSELDPRVSLLRPNGTTLASNFDIRTGLQGLDEDGFDFDCRLLEVTLPSSGSYTVVVQADLGVTFGAGDLEEDWYYALSVVPAGNTANPFTSELLLSPGTVDADGSTSSIATFRPRALTGGELGPGENVTFTLATDGDPDGTLGGVTDAGDGSYTVPVFAAFAAGTDLVEARVDGQVISTATVTWRGPVDAAASDFDVAPRRLRADGQATATMSLFPRDVNGVDLGAGRTVAVQFTGDPDVSDGPVVDDGNGGYSATLTAGTTRESTTVTVTVNGNALGDARPLEFGFPLE